MSLKIMTGNKYPETVLFREPPGDARRRGPFGEYILRVAH